LMPLGSSGSSLAHCSLVKSPRPMPEACHETPRLLKHALAGRRPVRDGDGFTARCVELGWLCAASRNLEEALARLRDLVEMELSHRAGPWPLRAIVVLLDVPGPQERK
jgi:hypothetical protein